MEIQSKLFFSKLYFTVDIFVKNSDLPDTILERVVFLQWFH